MSLAEPFPRLARPIVSPDLEARRPEARALLDAMGEAGSYPGGERTILIARTVAALVESGVWERTDALLVLAAHSAPAALLNWKNPATAATEVASPIFTADAGYAGDGVGAYIDTGVSISGGLYAQNDNHMAMWVQSGGQGASTQMGTARNRMNSRDLSDQFVTRSSSTANATDANTQSTGHFAFSRDNSADYDTFIDGAFVATKTQASAVPVAENVFLLTFNNAGSPAGSSTRRLASAHWGASLTAQEMQACQAALSAYMAGL